MHNATSNFGRFMHSHNGVQGSSCFPRGTSAEETMTKSSLATLAQCAEASGLSSNEMLVGVVPARKHERLLALYRFNTGVGAGRLSARICFDIRTALQTGAPEQAADLLVVLRLFLAQNEHALRRLRPFTWGRVALTALNG
jgi:hypothetical protein